MAAFATWLQAGEKSASTIQKYRREAARFAAWLNGGTLDKAAARAYKDQLTEVRSPSGVNGAVAAWPLVAQIPTSARRIYSRRGPRPFPPGEKCAILDARSARTLIWVKPFSNRMSTW